MTVHLLQTYWRIRPATFNARRLTLRNFFLPWIHGFFFSFFTGRLHSLKLIRLKRHHDRFCRSRREARCFKQKHQNCLQAVRASNLITSSLQRALHANKNGGRGSSNFYRPLLNGKKKSNYRKRIFFRGKNIFRKEHFGQYFLINSGVIVIEVVCSFVHPILLFLLLCRYLQDNKIQKLEKGTFSGLNLLQLL